MNDDVLARIRKLLALAEHPSTPAGEADAAARAAERLIVKHSVDEALLEARGPSAGKPQTRTVPVEAPYASAKTVLLGAVGQAHGVRAIVIRDGEETQVTLVGFASDLALVDLLWTSLLLQATTSLRRQPVSGRAFRRAFLIGFAAEVGARLQAARAEAVEETGGASTALVLRDRGHEVEAAVREQFPRLRTSRASVSDRRGLVAGRASGATANLTTGSRDLSA